MYTVFSRNGSNNSFSHTVVNVCVCVFVSSFFLSLQNYIFNLFFFIGLTSRFPYYMYDIFVTFLSLSFECGMTGGWFRYVCARVDFGIKEKDDTIQSSALETKKKLGKQLCHMRKKKEKIGIEVMSKMTATTKTTAKYHIQADWWMWPKHIIFDVCTQHIHVTIYQLWEMAFELSIH